MKKVLLIGLTPPVEGGSQRHILELSKEIKNTEVLTQRGSLCKNKIELPVITQNNLLLNLSFFFSVLVYSLKLLIWPKKYEIIHIHENLLYLLVPFLRLRYKVIVTVHGLFGFKFFDNKILWRIFAGCLILANQIISVSLAEFNLLKSNYRNVQYVTNGVDVSIYKKLKCKKNKTITFVGRIHEQKGLKFLLEAFSKINKDFPEYSLNIIGKADGAYYESLKKMNVKNIIWRGFILDRKELFAELKNSEILVYPSLWEALPWPALLEGIASGTPVIASDLSGMKDNFQDGQNILLAKPKSSEDLAKKISFLLNNKKKAQEIGSRGEKIAREFSWQIIAKKVSKIYNELK
jgi:glycosyltransferase involved in cell wall biosynthesis